MAIKADIVLKKELLKGNPGGYYVPGIDEDYNLSFTPTQDDMPRVEPINIKTITLDGFVKTSEYRSILDAEAFRVSAENSRATEENKRANAEANRASAEQYRVATEHQRAIDEAERASAELGRKQAEQARETSFNAHMQDWESDVEIAVNDTIANEANRASTFDSFMDSWEQEVNTTIDNANADVAAAVADAEAATIAAVEATQELLIHACADAITPYIEGNYIDVYDSSDKPLINLTIYGNSVKNEAAATITSPTDIAIGFGGKNLFNVDTANPYTVNYINASGETLSRYGFELLLPPGTYTAHAETDEATKAIDYLFGSLTDANDNVKQNLKLYASNTFFTPTFTVEAGDKVKYYHGSEVLESALDLFSRFKVQIEAGEVATAYEAPTGALTTFTFDELRSLDNIRDEVDFSKGVLIRRVGKVELDGETACRMATKATNKNYNTFNVATTDWGRLAKADAPLLVSHYVYNGTASGSSSVLKQGVMICSVPGSMYIGDSNYTDAAAYNAYLKAQYDAGTPITILYELETPIETALTAEQLAAYAGYKTIKPHTVITSAEAVIGVDYVADTQAYIDCKFRELTNAIVSLGSNI